LHGYLFNAESQSDFTRGSANADAHGYAIVYPEGLGKSWNAGVCCGDAARMGVDDVAFVAALMNHVAERLPVDPRRVYVTGFSNGGSMAYRLGCELATRIAAIAAVAGPLLSTSCRPGRPVPVLAIAGTRDTFMPYGGVQQQLSTWSDCAQDPHPVLVSRHGDASCARYTRCKGAYTELCSINGGGHSWPGGISLGPFGYTSTDLDASETIWQFFSAHPLP
jgi:polyhydroxybutyrate depolymerase